METIEQNKDIITPQDNTSGTAADRLNFLDDTKYADIKESLTKTITDLSNEHIVSEEDFRNNIEQVTKDIFSDPLFEFDLIAKENQANNIFLFRTKFEEIKNEEQIEIKEEQIEIKEEQTEMEEEQTEEKEEQKTELITSKSEYYEGLMKMYEETESTYKIQEQELSNYKIIYLTGLSEKNKNNFQKLSTEQQEGYLKARYAAENIANEAREKNSISEKHVAFIEQFNDLDKELNLDSQIDISDIPREKEPDGSIGTMKDIIEEDDIGEELIARNESIESFVKDSKEIIPDDEMENIFPIETVKAKVIERYPDKIEGTLDELLTKNDLTQYKDAFNPDGSIKDTEDIAEDDRKNLEKISGKMDDEIMDIAEEEQDRVLVETNEVIKMKAVEALIKNIGQYFQITSFQRGDLAESISIDVKDGIDFDKDMLTLSGNMDGREIAFYYDMQNGEIRADDFMHFEGTSETKEDGIYYIDKDQSKRGRERLPIKMKTLDQMLTDSKDATLENIGQSLENSGKAEDYRKNLSENIEIPYRQESAVGEIVIEHAMEKNTAVQELHDFVTEYMPARDTYGRQKEQYEYNLCRTIDTTFDRYTADEIKQWNNLFQRFQNKINEEHPSFDDEMISSLFDEDEAEKQKEGEYDLEKGPNIYQFFQGLTHENGSIIKEQVIDLNFFEQVVNELEQEGGDTKNLKGKSKKYDKLLHDFSEGQEQADADDILDKSSELRNYPAA